MIHTGFLHFFKIYFHVHRHSEMGLFCAVRDLFIYFDKIKFILLSGVLFIIKLMR